MTRPCADNPAPYDRLIDLRAASRALSREERTNAQAALAMCLAGNDGKPCPIRGKCWADNANEPWVESMRLELTLPPMKKGKQRAERVCLSCGNDHRGSGRVCLDCTFPAWDKRHGTVRGYRCHKTRKQDPCEPCRAAWSKHMRRLEERRQAAREAAERAGERAA